MPPVVVTPLTLEQIGTCGKGSLLRCTSALGELHLVDVAGTSDEIGFQYGALVGDRVSTIAKLLVGIFTQSGVPEPLVNMILDKCWERLAPHTPERYLAEMRAVAQGAQSVGVNLDFEDMARILTVTNLDMYKRDERLLEILGIAPEDLEGLLEPPHLACTMFAAWGSRTVGGKLFAIRNLDWISQTGMHEYRLLTLCRPEGRRPFISMGYAGVIGCLAGMNDKGITLSEVGTFSASEELDGTPWTLTARRVLEESSALEDAVDIITSAKHTIGYNYLIADGAAEAWGAPAFKPRAAAFETNFSCCEVFFEDDPKEHDAVWTDEDGRTRHYGKPLAEAILRADTAFGKSTRALQAADDGPGDPENTGNPFGRNYEGSTYTTCHLPMHDMIRAYETGAEYEFPVRAERVIEAGPPRKIGPDEALNIAATVAHNTEMLAENDWNVMSVAYAATDLECWVAFEQCDCAGAWTNAPDSGYWNFSLRNLLARAEHGWKPIQ